MYANQMKFSFMMKFDAMFEFSAPSYDDRQISWLLSIAQNRVFIDKYYTPSNKIQRGFEADEKRRRDLAQLIKQAKWTDADPDPIVIPENSLSLVNDVNELGETHPDGIFFNLPEKFLYAIEETAKLKKTVMVDGVPVTTITKEVPIKPVTHDQYIANINNPFKKPYSNLIWRMDYSRKDYASGDVENEEDETAVDYSRKRTELIIPQGYDIAEYRVRYLQFPPDIVVDEYDPTNQRHCVLDEVVHELIVDEAVKIAKASVKPQEYTIADKEKQDSDD